MQENKNLGYASEGLVCTFYENSGHICIQRNYTIPGGEIDLIMQKGEMLIFVEVKDVTSRDDMIDYVSSRKIQTLKKTIDKYIWTNEHDGEYRLDVVFVAKGKIIEQYCDIIVE